MLCKDIGFDDKVDKSGKCGIWTTGRYPFEEITATPGNGFVKVKITNVHVYSCYGSLNATSVKYELMLYEIV